MLLAVALASGCREKSYVRPQIVDATEFAMYSVRTEPDETHQIAVTAPDGSAWHREEVPGLNLRHIELKEVYSVVDADGGGIVVVPVQPQFYGALASWSRARMGNSLIFVFKGRPIGRVIEIVHEFSGPVGVRFSSEQPVVDLAGALNEYAE
ncbi:MAG: hypothetical protein ABIG44_02275 [Planctomycetota bacterium]